MPTQTSNTTPPLVTPGGGTTTTTQPGGTTTTTAPGATGGVGTTSNSGAVAPNGLPMPTSCWTNCTVESFQNAAACQQAALDFQQQMYNDYKCNVFVGGIPGCGMPPSGMSGNMVGCGMPMGMPPMMSSGGYYPPSGMYPAYIEMGCGGCGCGCSQPYYGGCGC